jgi:hypothetical protein
MFGSNDIKRRLARHEWQGQISRSHDFTLSKNPYGFSRIQSRKLMMMRFLT